MLRFFLILLIAIALVPTASAQVLWRGLSVGMDEAQITKIMPEVHHYDRPRNYDDPNGLSDNVFGSENIDIADCDMALTLKMENSHLTEVTISSGKISEHAKPCYDAIISGMDAKYGRPISGSENGNIGSKLWKVRPRVSARLYYSSYPREKRWNVAITYFITQPNSVDDML